ncbi:Hypothetical protein D9617_25g061550 [Elsinoe fawcettii]|nr:Hypothetical protein D9617_25g061550 [Elsinoe fawcettii]
MTARSLQPSRLASFNFVIPDLDQLLRGRNIEESRREDDTPIWSSGRVLRVLGRDALCQQDKEQPDEGACLGNKGARLSHG